MVSADRMAVAKAMKCWYRESNVASAAGLSFSWILWRAVKASSAMLYAWSPGAEGSGSMECLGLGVAGIRVGDATKCDGRARRGLDSTRLGWAGLG